MFAKSWGNRRIGRRYVKTARRANSRKSFYASGLNYAGNPRYPNHPVAPSPNGGRVHPRSGFFPIGGGSIRWQCSTPTFHPSRPKYLNLATAINRAATPLAVFRHRNFAFLWTSTTLLSTGTQMEALVLSWYVLNETGSSFLVGLTWTARMALNWMALFAGAIADRVPRQRLLAAVEFIMATFALVMFGLLWSGHIAVWHIFGIIVTMGMVRVFQMPSAQSLVADTLPPERIGNGAAFNHVGMNIGMLVGPLVGGILFKSHGPEGAHSSTRRFILS